MLRYNCFDKVHKPSFLFVNSGKNIGCTFFRYEWIDLCLETLNATFNLSKFFLYCNTFSHTLFYIYHFLLFMFPPFVNGYYIDIRILPPSIYLLLYVGRCVSEWQVLFISLSWTTLGLTWINLLNWLIFRNQWTKTKLNLFI